MIVDRGIRLINFMIDMTILMVLILSLTLVIYYNFYPNILDKDSIIYAIIFWGLTFIYYFLLEHFYGQTVGKMITKTKVADRNGNKPTISEIIIRCLIRLIPVYIFTFLFGDSGLHDLASNTKVIKVLKTD